MNALLAVLWKLLASLTGRSPHMQRQGMAAGKKAEQW